MNSFTIITTILAIILTVTGVTLKLSKTFKNGDLIKLKNGSYDNAIVKFNKKLNKKEVVISIQYQTLSEISDPVYENVDINLIEKI